MYVCTSAESVFAVVSVSIGTYGYLTGASLPKGQTLGGWDERLFFVFFLFVHTRMRPY